MVFAIDSEEESELYVFGGLLIHNYSISGFEDVSLSGVQYNGSQKGSLLLELEDVNGKGTGFGDMVGMRKDVSTKLKAVMKIDLSVLGASSR